MRENASVKRCNIPSYLEGLASEISRRTNPIGPPLVALDQNLNSHKLGKVLSQLVATGRIVSSMPLWYEQRKTSQGERTFSLGSLSRGFAKRLGLGHWEGASSDDEFVICNLVAQFGIYDRIVFLTADRGEDIKGIKSFLHGDVRPSLERQQGGRLGLMVLWQQGSTKLDSYIAQVKQWLLERGVEPGYDESSF